MKSNETHTQGPITIYIKECPYKGGKGYSYTFLKNPGLFKWMLGMPMFSFNKKEKRICSEAKEEVLDYLEISGKGKLRINKYHLVKEHVQKSLSESTSGGLLPIIIPKYDFSIRLNIQEGIYENKPCYFITTESILNSKSILLIHPFIVYHRKLSAFTMDRSEKLLAKSMLS